VRDAKTFNALAAKLDPKKSVLLLVLRENAAGYVVVKPRQ
jgi:serine protease Do